MKYAFEIGGALAFIVAAERAVVYATRVGSAVLSSKVQPAAPLSSAKEPPVNSFLADLDIASLILQDVVSFAAGQPVAGNVTIEGKVYTATVTLLPNGPVAPYTAISGNIVSILFLVLTDASAFIAGAPLDVAIKIGNSWSGLTLTAKAS